MFRNLGLDLFDPKSTYSYISAYYALQLESTSDLLFVSLCVSTPLGDSSSDRVFRSCVVIVSDVDTYDDLIILGMLDFYVILGMDCYPTIMWSWIVWPKLLPWPCLAFP